MMLHYFGCLIHLVLGSDSRLLNCDQRHVGLFNCELRQTVIIDVVLLQERGLWDPGVNLKSTGYKGFGLASKYLAKANFSMKCYSITVDTVAFHVN